MAAPHFDAPQSAVKASPKRLAVEEILTIEPPPEARIAGMTAWILLNTPTRFTSSTARK